MSNVTHVYRIRRKTDGLYSQGGMSPYFTKKGKVWKKFAYLKSHLNQVMNIGQAYKDCEVITSQVVEEELERTDITDMVRRVRLERLEKRAAEEDRVRKFQQEERRKQYEKLKKEFG